MCTSSDWPPPPPLMKYCAGKLVNWPAMSSVRQAGSTAAAGFELRAVRDWNLNFIVGIIKKMWLISVKFTIIIS